MLVGAYIATTTLNLLPPSMLAKFLSVLIVTLFIQAALWVDRLLTALVDWLIANRSRARVTRNAATVIKFLVHVGVWTFALVLAFANLGFDVTALITGLGIGGIAIALAA